MPGRLRHPGLSCAIWLYIPLKSIGRFWLDFVNVQVPHRKDPFCAVQQFLTHQYVMGYVAHRVSDDFLRRHKFLNRLGVA